MEVQTISLFPLQAQGAPPSPTDTRDVPTRYGDTRPVRIWETGVLVCLDIHMWTGTAGLDPDDLGLPQVPEIYALGRKYLVPRHLLRSIQSTATRAYRTLEQYSVPFPVGRARFVPLQAAPTLMRQLDELRDDFNAAVDRFMGEYTLVWQAVMGQEYELAARAAYHVSRATGALKDVSEEDFVRSYLERVRAAYPLPEAVRSKFAFAYHAYQITAPELRSLRSSAHAEDLARAAREAYRERMEAFFDEAVRELRARVAEACMEAAETISRTGTVTEHTLRSLRRMVEDFRALNFVDDHEVEQRLNYLEHTYLSAPASTLRQANAVPALRQALDAIAAAARDASGISRVTGELKRRIVLD